jgi:hypothetical protein
MNLVIHEFAHKLDMRNGTANGRSPLPATMPPHVWKKTLNAAFEHFVRESTAARTPPSILRRRVAGRILRGALGSVLRRSHAAVPRIPEGLQAAHVVHKQDPASRTELLLEE